MGGLVLSRAPDQKIIIGEGPDQITVMVVDIARGKVRLHIDAPRGISVDREEVRQAKLANPKGQPNG
jgi:carbon storage regulator CsrA